MSIRELRGGAFKSYANEGNDSIYVNKLTVVTSSTGPVVAGTEVQAFGTNAEVVTETFTIQVVTNGAGLFTAIYENAASLSGQDYTFVSFAFEGAGSFIPVAGVIGADGSIEITGSATGAFTYVCTVTRSA